MKKLPTPDEANHRLVPDKPYNLKLKRTVETFPLTIYDPRLYAKFSLLDDSNFHRDSCLRNPLCTKALDRIRTQVNATTQKIYELVVRSVPNIN